MKRSEKIEYVQKFLKESVEKGFPYPFQVLTEDGFFLFRLKNGKHECCARLRQTEELLNILCEGTKAEKEAATERIFDILRAAIRAQESTALSEESDYGKVKSDLILRPLNYQLIRDELEDVPHILAGDVALVLYAVMAHEGNDYFTAKMHRAQIENWQRPEREVLEALLSYPIPCIIFCRDLHPDELFRQMAIEKGVPLLLTKKATSAFKAEIIRWLNVKLAPCISVHGVLVDVYGEGVLITGESGIGKSEAALELIKRGHRLVSDDVVEIRKVSDDTLVGSAPDITKHFIEVRGIGIIDVKALFGASNVKETQNIDLVIRLEDWDKEKEYDRLGLEEEYTEYLGNKVVCHSIPIRPGRNLAVICESAAVNHRQKKMGYNAAQELYTRVQNSLARRREEEED